MQRETDNLFKNMRNSAGSASPGPEAEQNLPPADMPAPAPETQGKRKKFTSVGKRIHNELTYRGIDFLLNSTIGVAFTYWTTRTRSGARYFGQPLTNFFKRALSPVLKSEAALNEGARWGSMFTSIIVGGTAIIPPMVAMEHKDNKEKMIRWLDHKVHGPDKVESDPRFEEQYCAIGDEPKKNFTTGMIARIAVLIPMIGVTLIPEANKVMVKYLYNPIAKGSKALCKSVGFEPRRLMQQGAVEVADGDISKAASFVSDWDFIHRTIGFDLGLTFIYSFAHEATYKTLAAFGFKTTENGDAAEKKTFCDTPMENAATTAAKPNPETRVDAPEKRTRPTTMAHVADYTQRPETEASPVL